MAVEILGEAGISTGASPRAVRSSTVTVCGPSARIYQYDLDLRTLIWTRGASFPLSNLATRLKCPSCGSRHVALVFHMPEEPQVLKERKRA